LTLPVGVCDDAVEVELAVATDSLPHPRPIADTRSLTGNCAPTIAITPERELDYIVEFTNDDDVFAQYARVGFYVQPSPIGGLPPLGSYADFTDLVCSKRAAQVGSPACAFGPPTRTLNLGTCSEMYQYLDEIWISKYEPPDFTDPANFFIASAAEWTRALPRCGETLITHHIDVPGG
jgi:hypothetical protein